MVLPSDGAKETITLFVSSGTPIEQESLVRSKEWMRGLALIVCIEPAESEVSGEGCDEMRCDLRWINSGMQELKLA
jgi:hypothetical protein